MPAYTQLVQETSSERLRNSIAHYSGVQTGAQYIDAFESRRDVCGSDPNRKLERTRDGMRNGHGLVILNTFVGYGWHAVTPYRVEEISPTETDVYVYDSEEPGRIRVIHFHGSGSEWGWEYAFVGSLRKAGKVQGTCEDIFLFPLADALEQGEPPVDFCGSKSTADSSGTADANAKMVARAETAVNWLILDQSGRPAG